MSQKYYVTTPIYYINDKPHIGSTYTTVAADILARAHRLKGDKTFFLTGTDENSQKSMESATKSGKELNVYLDEINFNDDNVILRTSQAVNNKQLTDAAYGYVKKIKTKR